MVIFLVFKVIDHRNHYIMVGVKSVFGSQFFFRTIDYPGDHFCPLVLTSVEANEYAETVGRCSFDR